MLDKFRQHLNQHFSFLSGSRLFVAVSGGIDSMVLVDAMKKLQYDVAVLHCNFKLRNEESDADQEFVSRICTENDIIWHTVKFDTEAFATEFKLSIQIAARQLRYRWFNEQLEEHNYDYVLTAHHADDDLETFIINLSRGTGIDGLTGIPSSNDRIIRPMLPFTRTEIEAYAKQNKIEWRDDSSNASHKYLRNKIRHNIIPELKELNPDFTQSVQKTQEFLRQTNGMAEDAAVLIFRQVAQQANDEVHFNLEKLMKLPNYQSYLYRWLREYGFTAWEDVYHLAESQTGKQVFAPQFQLLKNRHFLILSPIREIIEEIYEIEAGQREVNIPIKISITKVDSVSDPSHRTIFVDEEKIRFPLEIRKWQLGDVLYPFGMDGSSKKVSKLFKDEKLSQNDKQDSWILCSGDDIVWVIGLRADERFKVEPSTKQILKIALT